MSVWASQLHSMLHGGMQCDGQVHAPRSASSLLWKHGFEQQAFTKLFASALPACRHTTRVLTVWLLLLPLALWHMCGWSSILIVGLTAFMLLGIEARPACSPRGHL